VSERVELDCGCIVLADHERGDRLVHCPGNEGATPCEGGIRHAVHATEVSIFVYESRRLDPIPVADEGAD
jgi:hypothetical protein